MSFFLAPSAPPANILVTTTAFDTIFISWGEVPKQERNGIVRKYKVHVTNSDRVMEHKSSVDARVTSLEVSKLVHNTYYCVQLLAYTVTDGPLSACVNVTTLEKAGKTTVLASSSEDGREDCTIYL